ncbi:competence type IV pilus minor pilin ComGD [Calidifontibacillus oryziterrae]|uniref:competence type IV pilus minor pilin ComGD n=1 Tax=Calidifontibacillus oryziterrae TaxID=1191699 RepID=UPI0002FE9611|nr:competence type IV pilus minor pilin ComGD [Calidifontibacillus oryziterrae]
MIKTTEGYTLVESMTVLLLVFIITTITISSIQPLYRQMQINHFFNQLRLDVSYAQLYAMSHNSEVHIAFFPSNYRYMIQPGGFQPTIIDRTYSKKFKIQLATLPSTVTFLQNGRIRMSGKMYVYYENDVYVFVFLFGKGLTYVKKL